jgi:hypothetical protein
MGGEEDSRARVIAEMNARRKSRMFGLFVIPLMYAPALPLREWPSPRRRRARRVRRPLARAPADLARF